MDHAGPGHSGSGAGSVSVRLAWLSNAPASMGRLVESLPWSRSHEILLCSGDLGVLKPDPVIYRRLVDELSTSESRVAFLGDRAANVAGAQAAGLHAAQFTGADRDREWLSRLSLPV